MWRPAEPAAAVSYFVVCVYVLNSVGGDNLLWYREAREGQLGEDTSWRSGRVCDISSELNRTTRLPLQQY